LQQKLVDSSGIKRLLNGVKTEIDRKKPAKVVFVADTLAYPIGWQQVMGWNDPVVYTNQGIWLRMDGREIDIEEYPELIGVLGVTRPLTYIVPVMTSNTSPSPYVIERSSVYNSTFEPWLLFRRVQTGDGWATANNSYSGGIGNEALSVMLNQPQLLEEYSISTRGSSHDNTMAICSPNTWIVEGSNDKANWIVVDSRVEITFPNTVWSPKTFICNGDIGQFICYKFTFTKNNGGSCLVFGRMDCYKYSPWVLPNVPLSNNQYTYVKAKNINMEFETEEEEE